MSAFSNPSNPSFKEGKDTNPTDAVRVDAHKEGKTNNLDPINNKSKMPSAGMLGIKGDGRQK